MYHHIEFFKRLNSKEQNPEWKAKHLYAYAQALNLNYNDEEHDESETFLDNIQIRTWKLAKW